MGGRAFASCAGTRRRRPQVLPGRLRRGGGTGAAVQRSRRALDALERDRDARRCEAAGSPTDAMSERDVRRRVESEAHRRLADLGSPGPPSPGLTERIRRRQALTAVIDVADVLAVTIGSVAVVLATLHRQRPPGVVRVTGPQGNRTTFLYGIRVSYPRTWSLLQLGGRGDPAPLFQLSSFGPTTLASNGCGRGSREI